ncbi:ankyrin repeat domain-containing protein, partial [Candidatus Woesearchaeota archaeon]|nr:ankyrin repeat domain-containing protein [Candidatus Woesearchaeota archaeon]
MTNILELINENKWSRAIEISNDIFAPINDNYNIFHYACIRGNSEVINVILDLKSQSIINSDNRGNTGCHLLAINGWDNILLDVVQREPYFLKLKNDDDLFVFNMLLKRQDILIKIIDIMKKNNMLEFLDFVRFNNRTLLLDVIESASINKEYLELLKYLYDLGVNFNSPEIYPPLIYALTFQSENYDFIGEYMIKNFDLKFDIIDKRQYSAFMIVLLKKSEKFALLLLDKDIDINYAGHENKYVPLSVAINGGLINVIEKMIQNDSLDYNKK